MEFRGLAGGDWYSRWWLLIALHYHRFVYVSHNQQHSSFTHQRSRLHLSLSPLPLFLSPYLFLSCPSISLPIYFPLPPLPSSSFDHSFPPSLFPLHSFLSSPPLSSHLFLSLSSMWVVMTLLSSRTPWNMLSECWNFRNFSRLDPPPWTLLWLDRMPPQTHFSPCSIIRCTFFAPRCYPALCSVSERIC